MRRWQIEDVADCSGGDALVVMVKSADLRHFDHFTAIGGLDLTRLWAVKASTICCAVHAAVGFAVTADHVLLDGRLGNLDPDLCQLAHDPRRTPDRIG
jgi:hypothetical protein